MDATNPDDLSANNCDESNKQQQEEANKTTTTTTTTKLTKKEQFVNTQKWNDIISSFCTQMPLKKHWRNLRVYPNCFAGCDAVDWMLRYLKTSAHFKHLTLNRHNAVAVLQIMFRDRLFEDVRVAVAAAATTSASTSAGVSSLHSYNAKPFADDDRLYRFSQKNVHYLKRLCLTSSSSSSSSKKIVVSSSSTASNSSISISSSTTRTSSIDQDDPPHHHHRHNMPPTSSSSIELSNELLSKKRINKNETAATTAIKDGSRDQVSSSSSSSSETTGTKKLFQNLHSHHATTNTASYKLASRAGGGGVGVGGELSSLVEQNTAESIEITKYKRISSPKRFTGNSANNNVQETRQDGGGMMSSTITRVLTLRPQEAEIWSKLLRKSLELTLRRAVLTCNQQQQHQTSTSTTTNNSSIWDHQVTIRGEQNQLSTATTLRRSYDIKIGLSKLLDKKAYEILQKAAVTSGAFICHNCNNVNKHGVVTCDKSDDMPDWVIKGMHELINWDSKNTEKGYIAFEDVFQQIVTYYRSLNEPLLTSELSYLFLDVFEFLLFIKDSSNSLFQKSKPSTTSSSKLATTTTTTTNISGLKPTHEMTTTSTRKSSSNDKNTKQTSSSLKIIEDLIENLRSQVKEEQRLKKEVVEIEEEKEEECEVSNTSRVKKIISLMNESAAAASTVRRTQNKTRTTTKKGGGAMMKINENIESKLIEDALLPVSFLVESRVEEEQDLKMNILAELNNLLELNEFSLTNRQKETIMQNLKPYLSQTNNNMTRSNGEKIHEFDEFLMEYKLRESNNNNNNNNNECGSKMSKNSAVSLNELASGDFEDDDVIDMDDDDDDDDDEEEEEAADEEEDLDDDEDDEEEDEEYEEEYLDEVDDEEDDDDYVDDLYEACQLRRRPMKKKSAPIESDLVSVRSDLGRSCKIANINNNNMMISSAGSTMSIASGYSTLRSNHATTIQNHQNQLYNPISSSSTTSSSSSSSQPMMIKMENNNWGIQKSLSEKRLRRNNSFRAAIESLPNNSNLNYSKKTMSKSSTYFSINTVEPNFKDEYTAANTRRDENKKEDESSQKFKMPYPPHPTSAAQDMRQQYLVVNHANPKMVKSVESGKIAETKKKLIGSNMNETTTRKSSQLRPSSASMVTLDASSSIKRLPSSSGVFQTPLPPPPVDPSSFHVVKSQSVTMALNELESQSNTDSSISAISNTRQQKNTLEKQVIESSQVYSMISAFRLLTLILPPKNRRKLHFLLRFLYKLKNADHTARNLCSLKQEQEHKQHQQSNHQYPTAQQQIELFILNSFVSSIVAIEQKTNNSEKSSEDYQNKLALKLAKLFVDNYSEIMGIPQDYLLSVRQKLAASSTSLVTGDETTSSSMSSSNKTTLTNSENISTKTTFSSSESSRLFDSNTIQFGPQFFAESSRSLLDFENPKMARKALNILGLNETTTTTAPHFKQPSSKVNFNNTTMFSSLRSSSSAAMNETTQDFSSSSRSSSNSSGVPTSNSSKHFLASSSISFSKFFNKKKKENLI